MGTGKNRNDGWLQDEEEMEEGKKQEDGLRARQEDGIKVRYLKV